MAKTTYDIIKKQNGETFARQVRDFHNGIFEIPDIKEIVKHAGRESITILPYLLSLKDSNQDCIVETKDPFELLEKAGYHAIYADTFEKQNRIKMHFAPNEVLCTFNDKTRFEKNYIINVVRHDVRNIRRTDFLNPQRDDKYGTSVMSIQISKNGSSIAIKNRYNESVSYSSNTLNSNPDHIIPGLSIALKKYFNVDFSRKKTPIPEGWIFRENKLCKYNYNLNNIYFGERFYVEKGKIHEIDKNQEIMLDYMILDLQNKKIKDPGGISDEFIQALENEIKDKKLEVTKNKDKSQNIIADGEIIATVKEGKIIELNLPSATEVADNFLAGNKYLKKISLPNLVKAGNNLLKNNNILTEFHAPKLVEVGHNFLNRNKTLSRLYLPSIEKVGNNCLYANNALRELYIPNLIQIGDNGLKSNNTLTEFNGPSLTKIGEYFLGQNKVLKKINLSVIQKINDGFMQNNTDLIEFNAPYLLKIEDNCFKQNNSMRILSIPNIMQIGDKFMHDNDTLMELNAPYLTSVGKHFFSRNDVMRRLNAPRLTDRARGFMRNHDKFRSWKPIVLPAPTNRPKFNPKQLLARPPMRECA